MPSSRVQFNSGSNNAGSLASNVTAGNVIVIFNLYIVSASVAPHCTITNTGTSTTGTFTCANGTSVNEFGTVFVELLIASVTGSGTFSYTTAYNVGGVSAYEFYCAEYSGLTTTFDVGATSTASSGTPASPCGPVTPTATGRAVVVDFNQGTESVISPWSNVGTQSNSWYNEAAASNGTAIKSTNIVNGSTNTAVTVFAVFKDAVAANVFIDYAPESRAKPSTFNQVALRLGQSGDFESPAPIRAFTKRAILTSGTSWQVPPDWNNNNNSVEVIAPGGAGFTSTGNGAGGGGGGGYSAAFNLSLTPGSFVTYQVGAAGVPGTPGTDSWFNGASLGAASVGAKAGANATSATGGSGGAAGSGIGSIKSNGGSGGTWSSTINSATGGGGGGGAGAPSGDGRQGGVISTIPSGGSGGGGAGSDLATAGNNGGSPVNADGGSGGISHDGTAGGAGAVSGTPTGGNGANGSGGGGGLEASVTPGAGGNGGPGNEFNWNPLSFTGGAGGGGGGGGGANGAGVTPGTGGNGGNYGGGGGGSGNFTNSIGTAVGGNGGPSVIVVTWTPVGASSFSLQWTNETKPQNAPTGKRPRKPPPWETESLLQSASTFLNVAKYQTWMNDAHKGRASRRLGLWDMEALQPSPPQRTKYQEWSVPAVRGATSRIKFQGETENWEPSPPQSTKYQEWHVPAVRGALARKSPPWESDSWEPSPPQPARFQTWTIDPIRGMSPRKIPPWEYESWEASEPQATAWLQWTIDAAVGRANRKPPPWEGEAWGPSPPQITTWQTWTIDAIVGRANRKPTPTEYESWEVSEPEVTEWVPWSIEATTLVRGLPLRKAPPHETESWEPSPPQPVKWQAWTNDVTGKRYFGPQIEAPFFGSPIFPVAPTSWVLWTNEVRTPSYSLRPPDPFYGNTLGWAPEPFQHWVVDAIKGAPMRRAPPWEGEAWEPSPPQPARFQTWVNDVAGKRWLSVQIEAPFFGSPVAQTLPTSWVPWTNEVKSQTYTLRPPDPFYGNTIGWAPVEFQMWAQDAVMLPRRPAAPINEPPFCTTSAGSFIIWAAERPAVQITRLRISDAWVGQSLTLDAFVPWAPDGVAQWHKPFAPENEPTWQAPLVTVSEFQTWMVERSSWKPRPFRVDDAQFPLARFIPPDLSKFLDWSNEAHGPAFHRLLLEVDPTGWPRIVLVNLPVRATWASLAPTATFTRIRIES